jgi:hypothetical protein
MELVTCACAVCIFVAWGVCQCCQHVGRPVSRFTAGMGVVVVPQTYAVLH